MGYRHFDTAILYENEHEVGLGISEWIREDPEHNKREDVFYTSKLWTFKNYSQAKNEIEVAYNAVKDSLGYIDLLLLHSPIVGPQGRLEAYQALQEAVDEGKVRSIGVSSWGKRHLEELFKWEGLKYKPVVDQIEVHPWCQRTELCQFLQSNGIEVEAYSPLAHGTKTSDPVINKILKNHPGKSRAQILLRWSIQHGYIPLPKTKTMEYLKSNLDVFGFELEDKEMEMIDQLDLNEPTDWECTNAP